MIFLLTALFVLLAWGMRSHLHAFNKGYLGRDQTNAIKGFFIGWVFLSHLNQYVYRSGYGYGGFGDVLWLRANCWMGQLVVALFLFYSGYGVMKSAMTKGRSYIEAMPKRRVLPTLLNFDVAVLLFVAVDLLTGVRIGVGQTLLSLVGWDSVGNSNWYIFVILGCYILFWLGFSICERRAYGVALTIILSGLFAVALALVKQSWWYNMVMVFPAGIAFAFLQERIDPWIRKRYWVALVALVLGFAALRIFPYEMHGIRSNAVAILFALVVVMLSMKIWIGNTALIWMGAHLFPIYIYQRIPMQIVYDVAGAGFVRAHFWIYAAIALVVTGAFAFGYRWWTIKAPKVERSLQV